MKKIKVEFEIEVADGYKIGDCSRCPFNHTEWYESDNFTDCYDWCVIDGNCEDKLKEIKND